MHLVYMGGSFSFEPTDEASKRRMMDNIGRNMARFNKSFKMIASDLLNANNFSNTSDVKKQCLTHTTTVWLRLTPIIKVENIECVFGRNKNFENPTDVLHFEISNPKKIFSSMSLHPDDGDLLYERENEGRIVINRIQMKGNNSLPFSLGLNVYNIMFNESEITMMENHRNAKFETLLHHNQPLYAGYLFNRYPDEASESSSSSSSDADASKSSSSSSSSSSMGDPSTMCKVNPDDGNKAEASKSDECLVHGDSLKNVFCTQINRRQVRLNNAYNEETKRYRCHTIRRTADDGAGIRASCKTRSLGLYGNGINMKLKGASSNAHDNNSDKEVYTSAVPSAWLKSHGTAERGCLQSRFTIELHKEWQHKKNRIGKSSPLATFMETPEELNDDGPDDGKSIPSFRAISLKDSRVYKKAKEMVYTYVSDFEFYFENDYMLEVYKGALRKDVTKKADLESIGVFDMDLSKVTLANISWSIGKDGDLLLEQKYSKTDQAIFDENVHRYKKIYAIPKANCRDYRSRLENNVFSKIRYFDPDNPFIEINYDENEAADYLKNIAKALNVEKRKMETRIIDEKRAKVGPEKIEIIHVGNDSVDLEQVVIVLDVEYSILKPNSLF